MRRAERTGRWDVSLALALLGIAAAWLAADYFRLGASSDAPRTRSVFVALSALASFAIGSLSASRKTLAGSLMTLVLAGPASGAAVGVIVRLVSSQLANPSLDGAALDGFLTGLGFLPAMALVLVAGRHIGRARAGSLVDDVDRRSAYVATALAIALGVPIAVRGSAMASWFTTSLDMALAIGAVACTGLFALAVADGLALRRGRASLSDIESLETGESDPDAPYQGCDFGIGHDELVRVDRVDAYRGKPVVVGVVRGDHQTALRLLRDALARTVCAFLLAVSAVVLAFTMMPSTPANSVSELAMQADAEMELMKSRSRPTRDGLPLTCEVYFRMAGGCIDRLPKSESATMSKRLDRIRTDWVTGGEPHAIGTECTAGLHDALDNPVCVAVR
jgi:hypothetical protein